MADLEPTVEILGSSTTDPVDPKRLFSQGEIGEEAAQHIVLVKGEVRDLADSVYTLVRSCPERTLAMRHLELAGYFAHAALVREGAETDSDGGFVAVERRRGVRKRVEGLIQRAGKLTSVYLCESRENSVALLRKLVDEHTPRRK